MPASNPKAVRRFILTILYAHWKEDPHGVLTPKEIMADGTIERDDLPSNAFYLHERGYIELMVGYEPPLFAAARISPRAYSTSSGRSFRRCGPSPWPRPTTAICLMASFANMAS